MKRESTWRKEWDALREERAAAREQWRLAADALAVKAHDPFGLRTLVRAHPVAATGIGAGIAALLVKLFVGRARARRKDAARHDGTPHANGNGKSTPDTETETDPSPATEPAGMLRTVIVSFVVPWLLRTLATKFGLNLEPDAQPDAKNADDSHPAVARRAAARDSHVGGVNRTGSVRN